MSESLEELFERARALDVEPRGRLLERLAAEDPGRAKRLAALLAAASGPSPLDVDPWVGLTGAEPEADVELPSRIGPYPVLSELGRGGMGRVYLALEESEGRERRLAVKIVAPEGDRPEIERRFRQERRILAALDHDGIARFHDAGRDAEGHWYLALEYVEGANLLEFAGQRGLDAADRVRLFLPVLEAVGYAHSRGIVHRDLKPSNILVGPDGRPRLLDFGIAKLLGGGSAGATTETRTAVRALTPAYASPEQVRGEPVSPASDVFSLGVVLYELLAGVRPFRGGGDSRGWIERQILETDPEPPSTASRRAAARGKEQRARSDGQLSRDLDAICLKALRKNPAARYRSVADFAADLERHLAGRPVVARGDDLRYRAVRFLSRHRAALAGAALAALALVALAIGRPDARAGGEPEPRPFPFSGIGAGDIEAFESAFVARPGDVEAGVRLALALERAGRDQEAALVVARMRQIPGHAADPLVDYVEAGLEAGRGAPQRALVLYASALERARAGHRGELVGQIRAARGRLLFTLGRKAEARLDLAAARDAFERAGDFASLSRVLNDLALDPLQSGRLAEGEQLLEQALAAGRRAGARGAGTITGNLALISYQRGHPDRAEQRFTEALAAFEASGSRMAGWARSGRALALRDLGRDDEAERELAEAIVRLRRADVENELAHSLWLRGDGELARGELARAKATADEIETVARRTGDRAAIGFAQRLRGEAAASSGAVAEARELLADARRLLVEGTDADQVEDLDVRWAAIELGFGAPAEARRIADVVRPDPAAAIEKTSQFEAEALLARLDAADGRRDAAARRLARLESAARDSTSRRRHSALAAARAELEG